MMERMGGRQARHWRFGAEAAYRMEDPDDISAGNAYIFENAPRTKKKCAQSLWMRVELSNAESHQDLAP